MPPYFRRLFHPPSLCSWLAAVLILAAFPVLGQQAPKPAVTPEVPQWPVEFQKDGNRLIIYQPQLRDWKNFRDLIADSAVSITPRGGQPVLGVATWHSNTLTDTQTRLVVIKDSVVVNARFTSVDAATGAAMEKMVREFPLEPMTISLDRMLAGFKTLQSPPKAVPISTQPPPIFVRTSPAVLLFVDGDPIRVPIEGTHLEYVVNTNWDLLYDKSAYFLLNEKTWLTAKDLAGPWKVTRSLPADMAKLPTDQNWDDVRGAIPPTESKSVQVVFTPKPAELILFSGQPAYSKIAGTSLSYATNTENDVFMNKADHQVYVLLSGRWFRAPKLDGPWTYAGNDLPADFAQIPTKHPKGRVLASVPGTQAARDAVMLAQVPTTVVVNRKEAEAQAKVVYTGEPQFKEITGTPLSYAINTQEKVIKVGDLYYLCFQGVWFVSASPNGPWKTADSVPKEIYQIPPSAPVYNVTYVTNTNPTSDTVESSSTAGYMGMFVLGATVGACVAYGTGYYYPPYYYWGAYPYPVYYGYPYSYGYRAVYNPATGAYGWGGAVYGPYGSAGRAAWYNPSTGTYGRAATVQTAYGGRTAAQAYNPWTGNWASTQQGHNPYAQWGSSTIKYNDDIYHTGHVKTANNLYAGVDGNVYKRDSSGNWSKWDNGWQPVEKSASKSGGQGSNWKQAAQDRPGAGGSGQRKIGGEDSVYKGTGREGMPSAADRQQRAEPGEGGWKPATRQETPGEQRQAINPAAERSYERPNAGPAPQRGNVSPETMHGLNQQAAARQQGAAHERSYSRGSMGSGSGGMRMGGRRR